MSSNICLENVCAPADGWTLNGTPLLIGTKGTLGHLLEQAALSGIMSVIRGCGQFVLQKEHPCHQGGPVFVFDINTPGFKAEIFGHSWVAASLVAEQVLRADEAINLTLARLCRIQG